MNDDKRKVLILDDQDGPQFFYEDEIRSLIDSPDRIIKCRSVQEVENEVGRSETGEIEIAVVLADIEILDRHSDSLPGKDHGLKAAEILLTHMFPNHTSDCKQIEVFNYVICSRYLEASDIYSAFQELEKKLNIRLPNKLERPIGLKVFRETVGDVFDKIGIRKK